MAREESTDDMKLWDSTADRACPRRSLSRLNAGFWPTSELLHHPSLDSVEWTGLARANHDPHHLDEWLRRLRRIGGHAAKLKLSLRLNSS